MLLFYVFAGVYSNDKFNGKEVFQFECSDPPIAKVVNTLPYFKLESSLGAY